jgi:UDP-N-acetylmuramoyl-L-alanyl-D-glutamate--2,6-diaminopimelate ligase
MMTLRQLLNGLTAQTIPPLPVTGLSCHSKQIQPGEVFVAVRGPHHDGHEFIGEATARGASAVVVERRPSAPSRCAVVVVQETRRMLPVLAARWYGEPAKRLRVIGVTGTNGKTTTTYLLKSILEAAGHGVGLLGTVTYQIGERTLPSLNTTPGALELQRLLAKMVEQRLSWCAMEVSSHALDQDRIDGVQFDAAVWTNLGSDHLDYHKTREQYAQAKRKIFSSLRSTGKAVINTDDPEGALLLRVVVRGAEHDAHAAAPDLLVHHVAAEVGAGLELGHVLLELALDLAELDRDRQRVGVADHVQLLEVLRRQVALLHEDFEEL